MRLCSEIVLYSVLKTQIREEEILLNISIHLTDHLAEAETVSYWYN